MGFYENQYKNDNKFKEYIDEYCRLQNIPIGAALSNPAVHMAWYIFNDRDNKLKELEECAV